MALIRKIREPAADVARRNHSRHWSQLAVVIHAKDARASEFDILQARLFGSVTNADAAYFPIVIPVVLIVGLLLYFSSRRLNVVALGKEVATSFGVNHRGSVIYFLILISLLMSMSTALIGPLTFFGFLVATLSYQVAATYDHKYVFPMAFAIGFFVLTTAYFFMYHIFNTPSVVSVIIELFGGLIFLVVLLRRGPYDIT